jgi:two-component system OmpR family sensor kinase
MTLRARLLVSIGLLVAAAFVVASWLVVTVTRANLVQQVDADLLAAAQRPGLSRGGLGLGPRSDVTGSQFAFVLMRPNGRVITSIAGGPPGNSYPLPTVPSPDDPAVGMGRIVDARAVDGELRYRLVMRRAAGGTILAVAAPLETVEQATDLLVRNLALIGAAVVAAILALTWLIVRGGLRPLERVASTADAIAAGDLSHRADVPDDRSEVGRLGIAFNRMLDQIQASFEHQDRALEAKAQSEQRLRRFVADASHELRTPLTALRGYADLYRAGGLNDPAALERAMLRIGTESRRMGSLVEDLLLLARIDQGRPLRREPVDLSQVVADAVDDARAVEPDRPVAVEIQPGVRLLGDEDRLRQVVGNLLANVRVHTPSGAPVEVELQAGEDEARVVVADHGPGVDAEHSERVFDRFYRADPARSRDRGGSGLGLSIAASVAQAHGGSIEHRQTPGGGATFVVTLPLLGSAAPA